MPTENNIKNMFDTKRYEENTLIKMTNADDN